MKIDTEKRQKEENMKALDRLKEDLEETVLMMVTVKRSDLEALIKAYESLKEQVEKDDEN